MIKEKILNIRNNHTQNLSTLAKYIRDTRLLGFCVKWNVLAVQQIRNHIMFSGTQNEREGFFCMNFNRALLFQYKEDDVVHVKEIENQSFKKDITFSSNSFSGKSDSILIFLEKSSCIFNFPQISQIISYFNLIKLICIKMIQNFNF